MRCLWSWERKRKSRVTPLSVNLQHQEKMFDFINRNILLFSGLATVVSTGIYVLWGPSQTKRSKSKGNSTNKPYRSRQNFTKLWLMMSSWSCLCQNKNKSNMFFIIKNIKYLHFFPFLMSKSSVHPKRTRNWLQLRFVFQGSHYAHYM
jgi:hypothetical protein